MREIAGWAGDCGICARRTRMRSEIREIEVWSRIYETPRDVCGFGDGARWNGHAARNFFGGLVGGGVLVGGRECAGRRAGRGAVGGDFLICACIFCAHRFAYRKKSKHAARVPK